MDQQGRIRRTILKTVLAGVEELPQAQRQAISSQMPRELVGSVKTGLPLGWASAEEYHQLVNPLFDVLGKAGFRKFYADVYERIAELPILGPITRTALKIGGNTPQGLAKYAGPAWRHLATGVGTLVLVEGSEPVRLVYRGYPVHLGPPELFAYAFAGTFDGFYRICRLGGHAEIVDIDIMRGHATFELPS